MIARLAVIWEERYGLGREFVVPIDRILVLLGRSWPQSAVARLGHGDVTRLVKLAGKVANRFLDRTTTGVGLTLLPSRENV